MKLVLAAAAAVLLSVPAYAECRNGNCRPAPRELHIQQEPYTVQVQPPPVVYRRVDPVRMESAQWVMVPQRVGLFGWRVRYVPAYVVR